MSGYAKLFGSILDSTVWREPDHVRLVWITMLAMADRDGVVDSSDWGIADRARISEEQCADALLRLSSPDSKSRTKLYEGRRIESVEGCWVLLNYEKYRDKATLEETRAKAAARQKRARARAAASRSVTPGNGKSQTITPSPESEIDGGGESEISLSESDPDPDHARAQNGVGEASPVEVEEPERSGVRVKADLYLSDPNRAVLEWGPLETWAEVKLANDGFCVVYPAAGKLRGRDPRAVRIVERFADGFEIAELIQAARGSKLDPHIANNASFQTVQTVWRDAAQVDKYRALLANPPTNGKEPSAFDRQMARVRQLEAEENEGKST